MQKASKAKWAEKALQSFEAGWCLLMEHCLCSIVLFDLDGTIILTNFPSIPSKGVIGDSIFSYISAEYQELLRRAMENVLHTGEPERFEIPLSIPLKESITWWSVCLGRVMQDGNVAGFAAVCIDITRFKQVEEKFRKSEETSNAIIKSSPHAIIFTDLSGNIIECNQAAIDQYEYSTKEELIGKSIFDLIDPEYRQKAAENIEKTLKVGSVRDMECNILTKNGHKYIGKLSTVIIHDSYGNPAFFLTVMEDITKRKQMMLRSREIEERYKSLFEHSLELVFIHDFQGNFLDANEMALKTFGYTREEIPLINFATLLSEDQMPKAIKAIKEVQEKGYHSNFTEYKVKRKDGEEIYVEAKASIIYMDGKPYAIQGIARDITEHKLMREMERLADIGRMVASIAHEINNPLAGIKNSFLLIKDAIPEDYPYFKYVGMIEREINRISKTIHQMLDLYRPEQSPREFSVGETIMDVVSLLETECKKNNVIIKVDTRNASVAVKMQETMLRQVLYNIIQNAIEASPRNGRVEVIAAIDKGFLTIKVFDQGSGIPEEISSLIFEPFYTTKDGSKISGLGLGLSVSKSLIEKNGGSLHFENKPDDGAVFYITLPVDRLGKEIQDG